MRILVTKLMMICVFAVLSAHAETFELANIPCSEAKNITVSNGDDTQIQFVNELDRPLQLAPTLTGGGPTDPRLRINPGATRNIDTKVGRTWIVYENTAPDLTCIAYFIAEQEVGVARITPELAGLAPNTPRPRVQTRNRTLIDQPDENNGAQLHFLYVTPSDGPDNRLDTFGDIEFEIAVMQKWLDWQVGRTLNIDSFNGQPDITFVRLNRSDAEVRTHGLSTSSSVGRELESLGFDNPNKLYVVFYDGGFDFICGGSGGVGDPAFVYLNGSTTDPRLPNQVFNECPFRYSPLNAENNQELPPSSWALVVAHEAFHVLGFIPSCTPDAEGGHLSGNHSDIMATSRSITPLTLDTTRSQYYGHNNDCLDLEDSAVWADADIGADPIPGK